jgi:DNA processing protein
MQVSNISSKNSQFPDTLRHIDVPPKQLYVLGDLPVDAHMVAIVGTRKCTPYGERVAYELGRDLAAAGVVVVSGLALGIDGVAHRGAIDAGGRTVAVLAHGLDQIYPLKHRPLAKDILRTGGALVSEYDLKMPPLRHQFVERNRIIAGLCPITVVVEAPVNSGASITAQHAFAANRQVMAVPGNITSLVSAVPNNLIRDGAQAVTSAADIITALGFVARESVPVPARSPEEAKIIELLGTGTGTSQDLIERSGLDAAKFANIISLMEITGKVRNLGAGQWVRR